MLPHTTLLNAATEEDFEEAREVMSSEYSNLPVIKNINVATEEDFEEAREVMSGEYSNLPVTKRSVREPIPVEELVKFATSKLGRVKSQKVKFPRNIQSRLKVGFFDQAGDTLNFAARIIIIS